MADGESCRLIEHAVWPDECGGPCESGVCLTTRTRSYLIFWTQAAECECVPGRLAIPEEHAHLARDFPQLPKDGYTVTHPADRSYNCIGWSLCSRKYGWVWPRREAATIAWFDRVYAFHGWKVAADCTPVLGKRKIALYCDRGTPTHAAKQRRGNTWISKLGANVRIIHVGTGALEGGLYGKVCRCYEKDLKDVLDEAKDNLADLRRRIAAGENGDLAKAEADAADDVRRLEIDLAKEVP